MQDQAEARPSAYRMATQGTRFQDEATGFSLSWDDGQEPEVKRIPATAWGAAVDQIMAGNIEATAVAGKVN